VGDRGWYRRPDAVPVRVARDAGGRARRRLEVVEEVRRSFRRGSGIMEGQSRPDASARSTSSRGRRSLDDRPSDHPIAFPIIIGLISVKDTRRPADQHAIVTGLSLAMR
jgi:Na+/H+-translocating membrane pyrophosphatase